jgi:hypothetical protein
MKLIIATTMAKSSSAMCSPRKTPRAWTTCSTGANIASSATTLTSRAQRTTPARVCNDSPCDRSSASFCNEPSEAWLSALEEAVWKNSCTIKTRSKFPYFNDTGAATTGTSAGARSASGQSRD